MMNELRSVQEIAASQINAYYEGLKAGVALFAWIKDGDKYVGSPGVQLHKAINNIDEERTRKLEQLWRAKMEF